MLTPSSINDFTLLTGKTGILGGTFDPIQNAHIQIAKRAQEHLSLDQVIFVPAYMNPLKDKSCATPEQRLEMTQIALEDNPEFLVSNRELIQPEPSYTWNTIEFIQSQTQVPLYFICGADCLTSLHRWYRIHDLLEAIPFCVTARDTELTAETFQSLENHFSQEEIQKLLSHMIPGEPIPGSATEARKKFMSGEKPEGLVPAKVLDYIEKHRIYQ